MFIIEYNVDLRIVKENLAKMVWCRSIVESVQIEKVFVLVV